ncbi:MAG: carbohydrate kinase family protein [Bacteroidales bacterium]|nr:carbohydrate kinase family protein [Bacteroidales bacterium]
MQNSSDMPTPHIVRVAGVGCCLEDCIYDHIDFSSPAFHRHRSRSPGDGGLTPGALVLEDDFERFASCPFNAVLGQLTHGVAPVSRNIGGPAIVALIHASQLTAGGSHVSFYGCRADDEAGRFLAERLSTTPVDTTHYRVGAGSATASTVVLSDPTYDGGHGERAFVNTIGASSDFRPEHLDDGFFRADINVYGGTALVPAIHDSLTTLLQRSKSEGSLTVVHTVFDFPNEKRHPGQRWPLGARDDAYPHVDLLIADREEALRMSGCSDVAAALGFFKGRGVGAAIVTNGANPVQLYAESPLFDSLPPTTMPVSQKVGRQLMSGSKGDTTGCGDNFAGGVLASLIMQKNRGTTSFSLLEACSWGIVSGGFACFYYGGTYFERHSGEKLRLLRPYYEEYQQQLKEGEFLIYES